MKPWRLFSEYHAQIDHKRCSNRRNFFLKVTLLISAVLAGTLALVLEGYEYPWTGFAAHQSSEGGMVPQKTLWDWLDLLIVPVVLSIGAYLLDVSRKRSERGVEIDRQRQQTLDAYFAYISELLLNKSLGDRNASHVARELARTQTLTALRRLDGQRKAQLLQFLYEAGLIDRTSEARPVIQLNGADLTHAILDEATLSNTELRGVYCSSASICRANLSGADLRGSDFTGTDFSDTDLTDARLAQANLEGANLKTATLQNTDLTDVDLGNVETTTEQRANQSASKHTER